MGCTLDTQYMPDTPNGRTPFGQLDPNQIDSTGDNKNFHDIHQGAVQGASLQGTQGADEFHLGTFLVDKFARKQPAPGNTIIAEKSKEKFVPRKSALNIEFINNLAMKRASEQESHLTKVNLQPLIIQLRLKYKRFRKQIPIKACFDINDLKQQVRAIYVGIIKQKLVQANDNKISINQCKIEISQQCLEVQILCLKYMMENTGFKNGITFFEQVGYFLKQLTGFLKTKYPRSEVVDSGQLGKQIKQINATEEYQYDMLKNAGFTFNSTDQLQITRTIKLFLNKIIDELEVVYPKFKQLIQSSFSQQKKKQIFTTNYKIGRKISENTAKYTKLQTGTIEVKSAEIQRVLIKWLEDLLQMILKPRQVINQKNQYKFYNIEKGETTVNFTKCTQNKCQQLIEQGLINKVEEYTARQKAKQGEMKRQFNQFNMNLINIFNLLEHSQHQVSKQQMEVIKFSYYNSDFISWIVEEQLIHSIKTLVQVGQQYTQSGSFLDLIKFKCNDLMRCQFFGNKKKILSIYKEFQRLDKTRTLEIIKIKNRFDTLMGDAMIFFKLPGSFIICQCQLILSNDSKGEDAKKTKNIEVINHFLYQLQRSPFGVLGQIGVFLKSKAQTVSAYCHIIELSRDKNVKECLQQHKQPEKIQQQIRPFVCSKCVKFYPKYSNLFKIHQCEKCLIKICNFCLDQKFQITEPLLKSQLLKRAQRFEQQFKQSEEYKAITIHKMSQKKDQLANMTQISLQKFYDKKLKELIDVNTPSQTTTQTTNQQNQVQSAVMKGLTDVFKDKRIKMKDLFKSNKIKVELIINYLQKEYQNQLKNDQKIMFIIATWKQKQVKFKLYDYNPEQNNIVNSYQQLEKYEKHQFIQVSDYDMILEIKSFNKVKISDMKKQQQEDLIPQIFEKGIYIFDGQDKTKMNQMYNKLIEKGQNENENYVVYYQFSPFYLIIDFDHSVKGSKSDGWVQMYLKSVPDLFLFRKNIQLNNQSIHSRDLICFSPQRIEWVLSIKILNLNQNKISDISKVLDNCTNIQELSIRENKIKQLIFNKPLQNLKYLNAGKNESIQRVKKLHNILNIQQLDLSDNKITYIIMDDDETPIFQKIQKNKKGQKGENKQNVQNKQNNNAKGQKTDKNSKNQKNDKNEQNKSNQKAANKQLLARLASKKKVYFPIFNKKSVLQFSNSQYPNLTQLYLNDNQIYKLPKFVVPRLKKLDASYNNLFTIDDFVRSQLSHLVELYLNDNKFGRIPPFMNVPKLKKIDLCYNHIKKLEDFMKGDYPQLAQFYFTDNKLTTLPKFNASKIQILQLDYNSIESLNEFAKGNYPQLLQLNLYKNRLSQLPQLNFPMLKKIDFSANQLKTVQQFAKLSYPNLHEMDLSYNKLTKFPKLTTPNLHKIVLEENLIDSIIQFAEGDYPKLVAFNISYSTSSDPGAVQKKIISEQDIVIIDSISKPKQSQRQYSERQKLNSERGGGESPLQSIIKEISQGNHPSVQQYYKTFLQAQQKVRGKDQTIEAATFKNMGLVFMEQQNYEKSIEFYQKSLELTVKTKGQFNIDYTSTIVQLARVYGKFDLFEDSLANYQKALQILQKLKGKENQNYITTQLQLATLYLKYGQKFVSVQMYEQCLRLQQKIKRKDSIECSQILKKIANCYYIIGDYTKSLENYQRCLKIQLKVKGKRTIEVADTMIRIGLVYYDKGDNSKALENYEKGIQIQKKVSGQESQKYAMNLKNIIELYGKLNLYQKAIFHSQKYYDIMQKNRGQEDQQCISALGSLAGFHIKIATKQAYEKALNYYDRVLKIQQRIIQKHEQKGRDLYQIKQQQHLQQVKSKLDDPVQKTQTIIDGTQSKRTLSSPSPLQQLLNFPINNTQQLQIIPQQNQQTSEQQYFNEQKRNNHYNMGLTFHSIGIVYQLLDQHQNALKVYQRCYQILQYIESDQSQNCIVVLDKIGNIYYKKKGELHNSIEAYVRCLQIKEKVYGQDSNGCIKTLQILAQLNIKINNYEDALVNMRKCHKLQVQTYGEQHSDVISSFFKIAQILVKLQDHAKALETLEKCMKVYQKTKGKQSIEVAQTFQKMAQVNDYQNINKKAIQFGERSLNLKQKLKGQDCIECVNTLAMLGKVYMEQKNYDKSIDIINRCLKIVDTNSTVQFSEHPVLFFLLGQVSLICKDSNIKKGIQNFQKSVQVYQKQNPYIFIFLPSQQLQNGPNPYKLIQSFYPIMLQKLSDCYEILQEKQKSLQKIKQCYQIIKSIKGEQHNESRRLMGKMIKCSGQNFVNEIIGDTLSAQRNKSPQEKLKQNSLDNLKKLILGK